MMFVMSEATSATATFLFTDIEGSTQLLKSYRAEYATILSEHHRLLREAFAAYGGQEIDSQGDAFFVAFRRAKNAILAAAAAQQALVKHSWPGGASVRVRMGIHTGEADVATDRYVGLSVHRAARISALGHGGQVLVSQTAANLLEDDEDDLPGVRLRDLGEHSLKDIARPVRLYQLEIEGLPKVFPPLKVSQTPERNRRRSAAVAAAALLLACIVAVAVALSSRGSSPPTVMPQSLVRIDPRTLKPADVVPIGSAPDLVIASGGFVWVTHHILRQGPGGLRNAGDRTLTRFDPETGEVVTVGGGLAPCGLAPDPSGDVWVANCFASGGPSANVVRIDATTLNFEATWPARGLSAGTFYRGLAYGGGSLWISEDPASPSVTEIDPQTGKQRSIRLPSRSTGLSLAWSGGYGDVWLCNFFTRTLTRLHASTEAVEMISTASDNPSWIVVDGDVVWVGDWSGPRLERFSAVGSGRARTIDLPVQHGPPDLWRVQGVWSVAAGEGYVWATTPGDHALWRIDPKTNGVTRVPIPHLPTGVTTSADAVWVTVRGR
jgi:class 3 adenylate cyclase/streptogramin lyase